MATPDDVRRIALALPETSEADGHFAFSVQNRGRLILRSDEAKFPTEPDYEGFPAVPVRLEAVGVGELEELLTNAWRYQAPRALREAFDGRQG